MLNKIKSSLLNRMMNVLTDILCDTSSLVAPQNFKVTLPQNKLSQFDISSKQQPLLLLDSVSQISNINRPLSSVNHSSPSNINIFNSSDQIHIPSNMNSGFEERNGVSVFTDSFPEIVPSWLAHDFMKVSNNLASPGILSNVSDIYSANGENEHLEMLDLGFTPELSSQDVSNNMNRSCTNDSQKILDNIPMQRFSNNESLIIPSFSDINNTHLHISMDKNSMQYQKFKQNGPDVSSAQSLMNTVLPCENELLHLPLPSNLSEQCLTSTSSPSIISNSQSQSHPVDVVCDKLPQININHLDSFLGNETTLSDIQLLRHDFPSVRLNENGFNPHSNRTCLDSYNPNGSIIPCDTTNILGTTNVSSLSQSQDNSVQVSVNVLAEHDVPSNRNCFSCNEIPPESPIEIVQCFKCKFCDYISIHKCAVASHINYSHSKSNTSTNINQSVPSNIRSDNLNSLSVEGQSESHFNNANSLINTNVSPVFNANKNNSALISEKSTEKNDKFTCMQCNVSFSKVNEFNLHLFTNHGKPNNIQLNSMNNSSAVYQFCTVNGVNTPPKKAEEIFLVKYSWSNSMSNVSQNEVNKISKRKIYPKKTNETQKKSNPRKTVNESTVTNNEKSISSHKKAWQKKMTRELGSYICEFKGCNVRFHALDNLEYHRKCHIMNSSNFECPECRMNFKNWAVIAGHLWRNHRNDMELHSCDQCSYKTYRLNRLENLHKLIHRDECLFLCDTCGKSFKNGKQLRNHRVIHFKNSIPKQRGKDLKCNICSKGFTTKRMLLVHQSSVHKKLKPFVCSYCEYSASKMDTMNLHMRKHTGEKPFKCDTCDYRTSDHNTLRRHKMTHSGEKPYKCPYCSYSCRQASLYKGHLKKHPDGNGLVLSCNICRFKTLKHDTYLRHMHDHEQGNKSPGENSMNEIQLTDGIFPLAEAMNMSFSQS